MFTRSAQLSRFFRSFISHSVVVVVAAAAAAGFSRRTNILYFFPILIDVAMVLFNFFAFHSSPRYGVYICKIVDCVSQRRRISVMRCCGRTRIYIFGSHHEGQKQIRRNSTQRKEKITNSCVWILWVFYFSVPLLLFFFGYIIFWLVPLFVCSFIMYPDSYTWTQRTFSLCSASR